MAAGGGLERSAAWTQILADTLGRPMRLCADAELTSRGAAAVALEQLGALSLDDVEPPPGEVVRPDRARTRTYLRAGQRQQALYTKFRTLGRAAGTCPTRPDPRFEGGRQTRGVV